MTEIYNLNWSGDFSSTTRANNIRHQNHRDSGLQSLIDVMNASASLYTKDGPAICPMTFNGSRSKINADKGSILLYDMDDWPADISPEIVKDRLGLPVAVHETFSSSKDKPHFRIIAFLREKIRSFEYESYWKHYSQNIFDLGLDQTTFDCTRLGYTLRNDAKLDFHIPYNPWGGYEKLIIPRPVKAVDEPVIDLGEMNPAWIDALKSLGSFEKGKPVILDSLKFDSRSEFVFFFAKAAVKRCWSRVEFVDFCSDCISSDFRPDLRSWLMRAYNDAERGQNRDKIRVTYKALISSIDNIPLVPIGTQFELLSLFLRIGYQLDSLSFFRSTKDIHSDLERDSKTRNAIQKGLNKLEKNELIYIDRGKNYNELAGGKANLYDIQPLVDRYTSDIGVYIGIK